VSAQAPSQIHVISDGSNTDGSLELPGVGSVSWVTHVGHLRSRNEDRFLAKTLWGGSYLLLLVADGAGGHEAGDAAASASVATFDELMSSEGPVPSEGDPRIWLHDTILTAHERVVDLATSRIRPPASTLVGVLVELESLCVWRFHVGDSRLYVRGLEGMVSQWTRDHNITNGLIDRGLSVAQAMRIADGGRLTQVVGGTSEIEPEIHGPLPLLPGQVLMLCSDGVYGHNENPEVLPAAMELGASSAERALELRDGVLAGDAPDNLTAILWQIDPEFRTLKSRETVTNSMPSLSTEAIQAHLEKRKSANLAQAKEVEESSAPSLAPEDALTVGAMEVLVPRDTATSPGGLGEDTVNTPTSAPGAVVSPEASKRASASVAAASTAVDLAVHDAAQDTRSALVLVLGLVVVLVATYSTVVNDLRGGQVGPAPEAVQLEAVPELPDQPEIEEAPELLGEPEIELPDAADPQLGADEELPDEELPGSAETEDVGDEAAEEELPGDPAVEQSGDFELPDTGPPPGGDLAPAPTPTP